MSPVILTLFSAGVADYSGSLSLFLLFYGGLLSIVEESCEIVLLFGYCCHFSNVDLYPFLFKNYFIHLLLLIIAAVLKPF